MRARHTLMAVGVVVALAAGMLAGMASAQTVSLTATLDGASVVPPVETDATGTFTGSVAEGVLTFTLTTDAVGITQAHIHLGGPDENGGVVAFLFGPADPAVDGVSTEGTITVDDLVGPLEGDWAAFREALETGTAYVQVHTEAYPPGEVRGQILLPLEATPVDTQEPTDEAVQPADLGATLDALAGAGIDGALQEIAVMRDWIPSPSAGIIDIDGAQLEVYALADDAAVEQAIANISGDGAAYQPPANATIWRSGTVLLILLEAPSNPDAEAAVTQAVGGPITATIAGGLPPPPTEPTPPADTTTEPTDGAAADAGTTPDALPGTGSGGLAGEGDSFNELAVGLSLAAAALVLGGGAVLYRRRVQR